MYHLNSNTSFMRSQITANIERMFSIFFCFIRKKKSSSRDSYNKISKKTAVESWCFYKSISWTSRTLWTPFSYRGLRLLENHRRWPQAFLVKMEGGNPCSGIAYKQSGVSTIFNQWWMDFVAIMLFQLQWFLSFNSFWYLRFLLCRIKFQLSVAYKKIKSQCLVVF